MKKIVLSLSAVLVLITGVSLYSCKKIESESVADNSTAVSSSSENPYNIRLEGNRIAFKTLGDYLKAVENPTKEVREGVTKTIQTLNKSAIAKKANTQEGDEYFLSMLSSDNTIQIDKWVFKLNFDKRKVYSLPLEFQNEYTDLVAENLGNQHIREFSFDDDVLEILNNEGGDVTGKTMGLICREDGVSGQKAFDNFEAASNPWRVDLAHNKYAIYFSITIDGSTPGLPAFPEVYFDYDYYHARCGDTHGPITAYTQGYALDQKFSSYLYSGGKNLNKYYINCQVRIKDNQGFEMGHSQFMQIRANY